MGSKEDRESFEEYFLKHHYEYLDAALRRIAEAKIEPRGPNPATWEWHTHVDAVPIEDRGELNQDTYDHLFWIIVRGSF